MEETARWCRHVSDLPSTSYGTETSNIHSVSFIPIVRRIFRRPANTSVAGNDTEYAWHRAAALLQRIKEGILGNGSFAIIASFVAAVLYVFQNEVKLRVARTIRKRVRKLCARLEAGDETIGDEDLKVFDGWRWKIVL